MKRLLTAIGAAVLALAIGHPAAAQEAGKAADAGETVSITAQVVDLSCKIVNDASGQGHQACATACAEKGQPLGLLTSDGQFYVPVNAGMGADGENARLKAFAEQTVKITGKVITRAGMKAIIIEEITKA